MQKPDKIYMENTNLLHSLSLTQVETRTEREIFLYGCLGFYIDNTNKSNNPSEIACAVFPMDFN